MNHYITILLYTTIYHCIDVLYDMNISSHKPRASRRRSQLLRSQHAEDHRLSGRHGGCRWPSGPPGPKQRMEKPGKTLGIAEELRKKTLRNWEKKERFWKC